MASGDGYSVEVKLPDMSAWCEVCEWKDRTLRAAGRARDHVRANPGHFVISRRCEATHIKGPQYTTGGPGHEPNDGKGIPF